MAQLITLCKTEEQRMDGLILVEYRMLSYFSVEIRDIARMFMELSVEIREQLDV